MAKSKQIRPTARSEVTPSFSTNLLKGESIRFGNEEAKRKASDEELNSRYAKGEIRIVTEQARYPLSGILAMLEEEIEEEDGTKQPRYLLDPEYQRRHRWNVERKSRLIESFLINVPVPPVFLYERDLARFEVMDGRQRLTALRDFYGDRFRLKGLQHWSDLDGKTYSELPLKIKDGIDRRYISSIILLKETAVNDEEAAKLKKLVFERLNSGGVKLGGQETRNAVYDGPLNRLCLELSENIKFRRMWGIPHDSVLEEPEEDLDGDINDDSTDAGKRMFAKMEDVELVLRFFAYRQIDSFRSGLNKMTEFLDRFIIEGNRFSDEILSEFRKMFESTVEFLWNLLESDAFKVLGSSTRPTRIVYDALMYVANLSAVVEHRAVLLKGKEIVRKELEASYSKNKDLFSGRRTNYQDALARNDCLKASFDAAIRMLQ